MTYHQLTESERYQIYALKEAGTSQQNIAELLMRIGDWEGDTIIGKGKKRRVINAAGTQDALHTHCKTEG